MKNKIIKHIAQIAAFSFGLSQVFAQNPIIQTIYTADPAPMFYKNTLYLYIGVDEPDAPKKSYLMREYRLFTTTDMVNWTDKSAVLKTSEVSWSNGEILLLYLYRLS